MDDGDFGAGEKAAGSGAHAEIKLDFRYAHLFITSLGGAGIVTIVHFFALVELLLFLFIIVLACGCYFAREEKDEKEE